MTKVLLTHPGTQYSYQLAKGLHKRGLLYEFRTGLIIPENSFRYFLFKLLRKKYQKKIANRILHQVPANKVKAMPFIEIAYLLKSRYRKDHEQLLNERNIRFQECIPLHSIEHADITIGFDTSSSILIGRVKRAGKKFILDQSIAHPLSKEKIYRKLNELYPAWSEQLQSKDAKLIDTEAEEHRTTDLIVVASTFTKNTLMENGVSAEKIRVNPYGVDLKKFSLKKYKPKDKVNFIFIGSITARKGIPYLLDIWKEIQPKNAVLNLVGPCEENILPLISGYEGVNYLGKIPHQEMAKVISENDVFLFPSFFEGFGLVILETMAMGLPVITTNATAGPDVMREGEDGFILDTFDRTGLIGKIKYFTENPSQVEIMGRKAREQAEKFSWEAYYERWENIITEQRQKNIE